MRILLGALLGITAAAANLLGGVLVAHRQWSRRYLKYFIALGAGESHLAANAPSPSRLG